MTIKTFLSISEEAKEFFNSIKTEDGNYNPGEYIIMLVCNGGRATFVSEEDTIEISNSIGVIVGFSKFNLINISKNFVATIYIQDAASLSEMFDAQTINQFSKLIYRPRFFYMEPERAAGCCLMFKKTAEAANDLECHYSKEIAACHLKSVIYNALDILERQNEKQQVDKRENIIADQFINMVRESRGSIRKVKEYADKLGISAKYLSANVLSATKKHATEWIDEYSIREIKRCLKSGEMSIQDLSASMNFSTPSHLTKFFREKTGTTPLVYRHKYQKSK